MMSQRKKAWQNEALIYNVSATVAIIPLPTIQ